MNGRAFDAHGTETEGRARSDRTPLAEQQSEREESMDDSDRMEWKRRGRGRGRVHKVPCQ